MKLLNIERWIKYPPIGIKVRTKRPSGRDASELLGESRNFSCLAFGCNCRRKSCRKVCCIQCQVMPSQTKFHWTRDRLVSRLSARRRIKQLKKQFLLLQCNYQSDITEREKDNFQHKAVLHSRLFRTSSIKNLLL